MAKFVPAGNSGKPGKVVGASKAKLSSGIASTKKTVRVAGKATKKTASNAVGKVGGSKLVKANTKTGSTGAKSRKASSGRKKK